jgi:hypothetical protein
MDGNRREIRRIAYRYGFGYGFNRIAGLICIIVMIQTM